MDSQPPNSIPATNGNGLAQRRAVAVQAILVGCVGVLSYIGSQALLPAVHGEILADVGLGAVALIAVLCVIWLLRGPKRARRVGDRRHDPTLRADLVILAAIGFLAMISVSTGQVELYRQNMTAARILRLQLANEQSILANQRDIQAAQRQSYVNEVLLLKEQGQLAAIQNSGATQRAQVFLTVQRIDRQLCRQTQYLVLFIFRVAGTRPPRNQIVDGCRAAAMTYPLH